MTHSRDLTERQRIFINEYCIVGNAAAAARAAGYSSAVARQTAHKLLLKPHIAAEIRRQSAAMLEAHMPSAIETLASIMQDPDVATKDRVRAAEVLLKHGRPVTSSAVALQVNVGRGAIEAQSVIEAVWAARSTRLSAEQSGALPSITAGIGETVSA
jgi:phage terminase small subunit